MNTITLTDPPVERDGILYAVGDGERPVPQCGGHSYYAQEPCYDCDVAAEAEPGPPAAWQVPDTCDTCRGEGFTMRELSRTSQEVVWCDCVDGKPLVTIDMPCPTCATKIDGYSICSAHQSGTGRVSFPATVEVHRVGEIPPSHGHVIARARIRVNLGQFVLVITRQETP